MPQNGMGRGCHTFRAITKGTHHLAVKVLAFQLVVDCKGGPAWMNTLHMEANIRRGAL